MKQIDLKKHDILSLIHIYILEKCDSYEVRYFQTRLCCLEGWFFADFVKIILDNFSWTKLGEMNKKYYLIATKVAWRLGKFERGHTDYAFGGMFGLHIHVLT